MTREERRALWLERINQWQESGLGLAAFARQHQLDSKRLAYWRTRHNTMLQATAPQFLIPVRIQTAAPSVSTASMTITSPGGWCISLPTTLPNAWLGELLGRLP